MDRAVVRQVHDELARNLVQRAHDDTASRTGSAKRREQMRGGAGREHLARRAVEQHLAVDVGQRVGDLVDLRDVVVDPHGRAAGLRRTR